MICKNFFFSLFFLLFFQIGAIYSQNPIIPPGVYMADPSAHVWADGRLYIYGSRDQSPNYFCSFGHDILSTSDLKHWLISKDIFSSVGPNDQVPYSDERLFAPDCQYKNGTYYLYYCLSGTGNIEGVATSESPNGPFVNGVNINMCGHSQIDPCVFKDDDGKFYYIWGQFSAKVAQLKSNMIEIDSSTIHEGVVTEKEHFFHEGAYMVKRKGIYYMVYTDMQRAGVPTCIGYSTSNSPYGPFKYGGIIIDNNRCDPGNWNDHGSLVEFKNKWYVVYHRSTHNSYTMRKVCMEPLTFHADGSIPEVEMTTQGTSGPLPATDTLDAERACLLYGHVYSEKISENNEALVGIMPGDKAAYKYLDFGDGVDSITISVAPGINSGQIGIYLDQLWSPLIGQINIPGNGDATTFTTITVPLQQTPKGVHALILKFFGEGENCFKVDWIRFQAKHEK